MAAIVPDPTEKNLRRSTNPVVDWERYTPSCSIARHRCQF